jgi:hypothetical protein
MAGGPCTTPLETSSEAKDTRAAACPQRRRFLVATFAIGLLRREHLVREIERAVAAELDHG